MDWPGNGTTGKEKGEKDLEVSKMNGKEYEQSHMRTPAVRNIFTLHPHSAKEAALYDQRRTASRIEKHRFSHRKAPLLFRPPATPLIISHFRFYNKSLRIFFTNRRSAAPPVMPPNGPCNLSLIDVTVKFRRSRVLT